MNITLQTPNKVAQFACIMKNLKNFSQDIEFIVNENGIYTQGMDGGHCCLFELILKPEWFDSFETDNTYTLGLNCELLAKVLSCLEQNQSIKMQYSDKRDNLFISLSPNDGESGIIKVFRIPLIDIEQNLLEIPDTEYTADVTMLSDDFVKLVSQMSIFGSTISFELGDTIKMTGKGDNGTMDAIIKEDDILMYAIEEDAKLSLEFSGSYINMMSAFNRLNKQVQINFSENVPMKIQFGLDGFMDDEEEDEDEELKDKNFIRLFLAPKINDD